jgi:glycerate-2-kinase
VTVTGDGVGGRNQELALSAALELAGKSGVLLASVGSDGIDGPTAAAGAWADGDTVERGRQLGLEASDSLESNDAHSFFSALDDLIVTGPTGTNVMDLVLLLVE